MRRLVTAAVLLLLGSSAYAQTTCSATCRACGSTVVGGSGGAPTDAQYVTAAADATLSAERVCTDTTTIDCDAGTAGQMKFNLITPIQVATGCATPNFSFVDDSGAGVCLNAADVARLQIGTTDYVQVDTNQFIYVKGGATVMTVTGYGLTFGSTAGTADWFVLTPQAAGAAGRYGELTTADLTANRTFTFPDATGDVAVIASTGFPVRTAAQTWATRCLAAGTGVTIANECGTAGNITVSLDTATTPQFSSGTGLPAGTCTVGQTYLETDVPRSCECSAPNTWVCSSQTRTHATDCTALTDGLTNDLCWELDSERAFLCQPTAGGCDTAGEWIAQTVSAAQISSGDVAFSQIAQASGASVLVGRGSAGGAGDFQEITLGSNLSMSGTTLSASAGASFDPGTTFELYEEFASGELSQDRIGKNGLRYPVLSSGDGAYVASTATHPGLFRLTSSTTDNSGAFISAGGGGSSFHNIYDGSLLNTNDWQIDTVLVVGSNSTAITTSAIWVGWTPSVTGTPDSQGNGIWIRRDTDFSDTAFVFQVCDGAGATGCGASGDNTNSTVVTSTITPSAGTAYRFRIRYDPTGVSSNPTLYFRVNNETEKTFCSSGCDDVISNMPGGGVGLGYFVVAYFTRDVSTRSGDVDYLYIKVENLARY